ncbi:MAG: TolC family protein [Proteobacteria bacterium]|nr:MAG: TolC family protein [Pseudomonadota bacterium]
MARHLRLFTFTVMLGYMYTSEACAQSISDLWELTQKNDVDLQSAKFRVANASQSLESTGGNLAPSVSVSGLTNRENRYQDRLPETVGYTTSLSARVSQPLINNPLDPYRKVREKTVLSEKTGYEAAKRSKLYELVTIYIQAAQNRNSIRLLKQSVIDLVEQRKLLQARMKARFRSVKDVDRITLIIEQRQLQIMQSQRSYRDLLFKLRAMTYLPRIAIPKVTKFDVTKVIDDYSGNTKRGVNPEVKALEANISLIGAQAEQVLYAYKPNLSAFMQLSADDGRDRLSPFEQSAASGRFQFGLELTWLLADNGINRVEYVRTLAETNQLKAAIRNKIWTESESTGQIQRNIEKSFKTLARSQRVIDTTLKLLESTREEVEAGITDTDTLLNLKGEVAQTEVTYMDASFTVLNDWIALLNVENRLDSNLLKYLDEKFFIEDDSSNIDEL